MTITAAAKALGVSRTTIYRMIDDKELTVWRDPVLKRATSGVKIPREEIDRLLAKRRHP